MAACRAARAILGAYDRGVLDISSGYLADTLRMVLAAIGSDSPEDPTAVNL